MLGSACQVVRGFCAFACLELVYAGGGGGLCSKCGFLVFMMAWVVICDFASLRTCTE